MNKQIKTNWVAALRSGKYKQIKESLCDGTGSCCLGVLTAQFCEARPGEIEFRPEDATFYWRDEFRRARYEQAELPTPVMVWAGFKTSTGEIRPRAMPISGCELLGSSLAELNDSGFTFPQIADVIDYLGADYF